jgi:hypothetical protein
MQTLHEHLTMLLPACLLLRCRLNIQLADADTSQQPVALQLLPALATLAVTFPNITHLSFSQYVEPGLLSDVGRSAPKVEQQVQLDLLRCIASTMHGMLQHAVQQQEQMQQTAAEERGELHVAVDPAQFVLHAILHQQQIAVGHDLQQQQDGEQQQLAEQQQQQQQLGQQASHTVTSGVATPACSTSSNSSSSSSAGGVLWAQLSEVDECPADPLILAFLLAVAPGIQTLRFRSQQCTYYEVWIDLPAPAAEPSSDSGSSAAAAAAEYAQNSPGSSSSSAATEAVDEQHNNAADDSSSSTSVNNTSTSNMGGSSSTQEQQPQESSNLWFDLPADANLQQQWQILASTAPSSSSSSSRKGNRSAPALATGYVYSPWCLLQCVQLLQRYAPQVRVCMKAVVLALLCTYM